MNEFPKSNFTANLLNLNRSAISDFGKWLFRPGMGYEDIQTWWSKDKVRSTDHEGLDFATYLDSKNQEMELVAGIIVPPFFHGKIVKIIKDFLGETIVIEHDIADKQGNRLHTFNAHLTAADSPETGRLVAPEEGIGTIATGNKNCPAHLHISTVWLAPEYSLKDFNWEKFRERQGFRPCNPNDFL